MLLGMLPSARSVVPAARLVNHQDAKSSLLLRSLFLAVLPRTTHHGHDTAKEKSNILRSQTPTLMHARECDDRRFSPPGWVFVSLQRHLRNTTVTVPCHKREHGEVVLLCMSIRGLTFSALLLTLGRRPQSKTPSLDRSLSGVRTWRTAPGSRPR